MSFDDPLVIHFPSQTGGAPTPGSLGPAPAGAGPAGKAGQAAPAQGTAGKGAAQDAGGSGTQAPGGNKKQPNMQEACMSNLPLLIAVPLIFYFLLIRPQSKQEKRRKLMLKEMQKGDKVVTNGGVHGEIAAIEETVVVLKFGNDAGQRMRIERSAIGRVIGKDGSANGKTKGA